MRFAIVLVSMLVLLPVQARNLTRSEAETMWNHIFTAQPASIEDWRACLRRTFRSSAPRDSCSREEGNLRGDIYQIIRQSGIEIGRANEQIVARTALDRLYGLEYVEMVSMMRRGCLATQIGIVCLGGQKTVNTVADTGD